MGLLEKIVGEKGNRRRPSDYLDLEEQVSGEGGDSVEDLQVHFSEVDGNEDIVKIKDKLYDGDIVIVDMRYASSSGLNPDTMLDQLQVVVNEVNGDIAMTGEDMIIISPDGVGVNREKL